MEENPGYTVRLVVSYLNDPNAATPPAQ